LSIKAGVVRNADTIVVATLWNFTMTILLVKTLVSPKKVIREVGLKLKRNWISAFCFAPIVTEKSMLKAQLSAERRTETAGELLEVPQG
jgi:hypothetical protein